MEAARESGLEVHWCEAGEALPARFGPAIRFAAQARIDAGAYMLALAREVRDAPSLGGATECRCQAVKAMRAWRCLGVMRSGAWRCRHGPGAIIPVRRARCRLRGAPDMQRGRTGP